MTIEIKTNNQWRDFVYRDDVPANIIADEFNWTTEDDIDGYFKYKGVWYHISEFMCSPVDGWSGIASDSFFSGVLIRFSDDCEQYQIATYFSKG